MPHLTIKQEYLSLCYLHISRTVRLTYFTLRRVAAEERKRCSVKSEHATMFDSRVISWGSRRKLNGNQSAATAEKNRSGRFNESGDTSFLFPVNSCMLANFSLKVYNVYRRLATGRLSHQISEMTTLFIGCRSGLLFVALFSTSSLKSVHVCILPCSCIFKAYVSCRQVFISIFDVFLQMKMPSNKDKSFVLQEKPLIKPQESSACTQQSRRTAATINFSI